MTANRSLASTHDPKEISLGDITVGDVSNPIGNGSYASVYFGEIAGIDETVAIKCIALEKMKLADCEKEKAIMAALATTNAPNTIRLYAYANFASQTNPPIYVLAMQLAVNGTLDDYLYSDANLTLENQTQIVLGLSKALTHMHSLNILHCDIKPANVLLDSDLQPKLSDFGLSCRIGIDVQTNAVGSPIYMAPECLMFRHPNTKMSDVYSLAVTFFEIISRKPPYENITELSALVIHVGIRNIREPLPDESICPKPIAHLINWGWAKQPGSRPTAAKIEEELTHYHDQSIASKPAIKL